MITTLSRQARRYPQMRSGWSAHQPLVGLGELEDSNALTGQWSNVIHISADRSSADISSDRGLIAINANRERVEQ